jgi:murein DD-endopeptidase MepM/ murein hydrolase activator NlpD
MKPAFVPLSAAILLVCAAAVMAEETPPFFAAIPDTLRPGEPVTVIASPGFAAGDEPPQAALYNAAGKRLLRAPFFDVPSDTGNVGAGNAVKAAVLAVSSLAEPGNALIKIENAKTVFAEIPLVITERKFTAEEIALNSGNTALRTVPDPQKTAESELLTRILYTTGETVYTTGPFLPPLAAGTFRTSFFGDRRVYRYSNGTSDVSVHAGIDYRAATGTPVKAAARGRVVLACFRIVTGYSVVIEHLPGVYSLYYHLDRVAVAEGAVIEAGTIIGFSGATGLATGPHLHWEIRAAGENTDPDALVARPILDLEKITALRARP